MAGWPEPVEVGRLAWGSWPETFIFLVSGRGGSGRLAGGCVESGASKVWPGFLQEGAGAAELDCWPPLVSTTLSALATLGR